MVDYLCEPTLHLKHRSPSVRRESTLIKHTDQLKCVDFVPLSFPAFSLAQTLNSGQRLPFWMAIPLHLSLYIWESQALPC